MFGRPYDVAIPAAHGSHWGGDDVMLDHLFSPTPPPDPLGQAATHIDGAAAVLLGIAANRSIETGQPIDVDDLLKLPEPASDH